MARTKDKRFRNLSKSIDNDAFRKLNLAQRLYFLDTSEGRGLLYSAGFTPQQLQSYFPYPSDITKSKLQSVTTGTYGARMPGDKGDNLSTELKNKASGGGGGGKSDPKAVAQLTKEQKETLELLQKGNIDANDPRVAFLKNISDADLEKAGIKAIKGDTGQIQSFGRSEINVSDQDIEVARKTMVTGGSNKEIIQRAFADELRKKGVAAENIPYAVAALSGQVQAESGFNPTLTHDNNTGYGIYGARDPTPGRGRKTDMFNWLNANG